METMKTEQDGDAKSPSKRKADEPASTSTEPQSKRYKPTEELTQAPVQQQHQHQHHPPTTTSSSPSSTHLQRNQALQAELHFLEHALSKKRDALDLNDALFEDLAGLYGELSDITQRAPRRTCLNDWMEDLSIQLLEILRRMEEDELEIRRVEGRCREIVEEMRGDGGE